MNRRGFISKLAGGLFAFSILPAAETYTRIWKPTPILLQSDNYMVVKEIFIGQSEGLFTLDIDGKRYCSTPDAGRFETILVDPPLTISDASKIKASKLVALRGWRRDGEMFTPMNIILHAPGKESSHNSIEAHLR